MYYKCNFAEKSCHHVTTVHKLSHATRWLGRYSTGFFKIIFFVGCNKVGFFWGFFLFWGFGFFFLFLIASELFFINDQCLTYLEEHLEKIKKNYIGINSTKLSSCFVNDSIHLIFNGIVLQVSDVVPGPLGLCLIYNRGSIPAHCLVAILILSIRILRTFFSFQPLCIYFMKFKCKFFTATGKKIFLLCYVEYYITVLNI